MGKKKKKKVMPAHFVLLDDLVAEIIVVLTLRLLELVLSFGACGVNV